MRKDTRKERFIACVALLLVLSGVGYLIVQRTRYLMSGIGWCKVPDFSKYKKSYELVANRLWENYFAEKENNDSIVFMTLSTKTKETWTLSYNTGSDNYYISVVPTEEETAAISEITKLGYRLKGIQYFYIHVDEKQIAFVSAGGVGVYAVIRVRGMGRPKYMIVPDEEEEPYIIRLSGKWYQGIYLDH